jgi:hypothetical protein
MHNGRTSAATRHRHSGSIYGVGWEFQPLKVAFTVCDRTWMPHVPVIGQGRQCANSHWGIFGTDRRNSARPLSGGRETFKRSEFPGVPAFSGWRSSCPYGWRVSCVSSSSLFDRADAGIWAERQPAVPGLVSRHHVRGVPASGLSDVPERERPRQLQKRRRWGGRVCSRTRAAHRRCSGRAERPRCSSVPVGPFAY